MHNFLFNFLKKKLIHNQKKYILLFTINNIFLFTFYVDNNILKLLYCYFNGYIFVCLVFNNEMAFLVYYIDFAPKFGSNLIYTQTNY